MTDSLSLEDTLAQAFSHHQAGRLREAEPLYRAVLARQPRHPDANHNLGVLALQLRQPGGALPFLRTALDADRARPQFWATYASALAQSGQAGAARDLIAQARAAGAASPSLDTIAQQVDQMAAAAPPETARSLHDRGLAASDPAAAAALFRRAIALEADFAAAHVNLAGALLRLGLAGEALTSARRAVELDPNLAEAHSNLGAVFESLGRTHAAEAAFRRAATLKPDLAAAHANLGGILRDLGRFDEALACFRQALSLSPGFLTAFSNLLFTENCMPGRPVGPMTDDARRYGELAAGMAKPFAAWRSGAAPGRLRVGLVSGDLRSHPVGYFVEGLLAAWAADPGSRIEVFGYFAHTVEDAVTARIKAHCHTWRPAAVLSDEALARQVHDDGVDVLIDLAGHTANNRLAAFAWKPAPTQASWLGYFATTGVAAIDYLIADPIVSPAAEAGQFTETVWRLPETYLCMSPPAGMAVTPLPASASGQVTFGSFNNLAKIGDEVVSLWARILLATPGSRLMLRTRQLAEPEARAEILARFARHGVAADRVILEEASTSRSAYLDDYGRVDLCLDSFPYPGVTTSVESLWMGVPVLTMAGDRFLSHMGETIAHNAGLTDWIAADPEDYVAKAVAHAGDLPKLAALRAGLRDRVRVSPLFDTPRFARDFEAALFSMSQAKGRT